jgi:hypothetical protein
MMAAERYLTSSVLYRAWGILHVQELCVEGHTNTGIALSPPEVISLFDLSTEAGSNWNVECDRVHKR